MALFRILWVLVLLFSCSGKQQLSISLTDNPCVEIRLGEDASFLPAIPQPGLDFFQGVVSKGSDALSRILQFENKGTESVFFNDNQGTYFSSLSTFPLPNNKGSLWISESEEDKAYHNCLKDKLYSVYSYQNKKFQRIEVVLFSGIEVTAGSVLEIEMTFPGPGKYRVDLIHRGTDPDAGLWGLNKSQFASTGVFTIAE